jgi:hypothetical protein
MIFKDHHGKLSMMRVGFFVCLAVGSILSLGGLFAAFKSLADATTLINAGTLLMGSSGFAKAIQTKWESSNDG